MKKKKILILTSSGGFGHISATKALQEYLGDEFDTQPVYVFVEIFKSLDPASILTFGKYDGEKLYNYFLKKKWYWIINSMYKTGNWYFKLCSSRMTKIADRYLKKHKPDLIVSVCPLINGVMLHAAQINNIPFMIVPTDLDARSFTKGICTPKYDKFYMTIAYDDPDIWNTLKESRTDKERVSIVGFPLRTQFLKKHDKHTLKTGYGIPSGKPVILLLMGGQGSQSLITFAKEIARVPDPMHVIICMGKDHSLKKELDKINFNSEITISLQPYTEHMHELMAMSDIIITKSGSVSFNESIYMNIPMILDATHKPLMWERLNHLLVTHHHWGTSLKKYHNLHNTLKKFIEDEKLYITMKKNLDQYEKKQPDIEIPKLIKKII